MKERLTGGDVIVVEVIRETAARLRTPGRIRQRPWAHNLWEELFSARVPKSSAEVRRVFVHHIVEVEVVGQEEEPVDQRDDEEGEEMNGGVEEIRSNPQR